MPFRQADPIAESIVVRTTVAPEQIVPAVTTLVKEVDPTKPGLSLHTPGRVAAGQAIHFLGVHAREVAGDGPDGLTSVEAVPDPGDARMIDAEPGCT